MVYLKLTEILNSFVDFLLNWNLDKFPNVSVTFEGEKMVDHAVEIQKLKVFGVNCFNCD